MFASLDLPFLAARACALGMRQPGTAAAAQAPALRLLLKHRQLQPVPVRYELDDTPSALSAPNDGFPTRPTHWSVEVARAAKGQEERFPPTRLSAGCGFRKETIAGMRRNGRDAPTADIRSARFHSLRRHCLEVSETRE